MKILTIRNHKVLLDDADFERLKGFKWYIGRHRFPYAVRNAPNRGGNVLMHHDIIGRPPDGMMTDHIDRNKLNNQRSNLRHVTAQKNAFNRKICGVVPLRGVCESKGRFQAAITLEGESVYLGRFATPYEAHLAWRAAHFFILALAMPRNAFWPCYLLR